MISNKPLRNRRTYFLYFWAHTNIAGAINMMKLRVVKKMKVTVAESDAVRSRDDAAKKRVKGAWMAAGAVY
jgi:hypothetical protein